MSVCSRRGVSNILRSFARQVREPVADLPIFLCPGLLQATHLRASQCCSTTSQPAFRIPQQRLISSTVSRSGQKKTIQYAERLPAQCAGCGALSQTVLKDEPGFYTLTRRSVKEYMTSGGRKTTEEDLVIQASLKNATATANNLNLGNFSPTKSIEPPVCDRCHALKHHDTGVSIYHPSIHNIQDTLFESPFKYNHIYHVIDAADFPMSLVPSLYKLLQITPQRSLNRRSKTGRFYNGQKTEVSFIVTRSDLLAPAKAQVDSMMPYLRDVLRDALGRAGKDVRLGNVRCVSSRRGWWTKELKEDIWKRGGGGWLVGKVNVGKSQLFHDIFPKGRSGISVTKKPFKLLPIVEPEPDYTLQQALEGKVFSQEEQNPGNESALGSEGLVGATNWEPTEPEPLNTSLLLPPTPPETNYPEMPLVSSLPGTTASPIRLSFGNGKGELIDLPGLSRGDLELHVKPEHRSSLVMRSRVRPEQQVIKPGQSLLLGGFIRITPTDPDVIILSYAFTPILPHLTSTEKAIGTQEQTRESTVQNISIPGTGENIRSAGTFHLKWDVTKERAGPITRKDAAAISVERLPYQILATDILIEGCGWVELVAQVRKRRFETATEEQFSTKRTLRWGENEVKLESIEPPWPAVEVFSPNGKFIASRRPMNAWLHLMDKPGKLDVKGRPRKSMKGAKKLAKQRARASV
ncbi:hypothetical protein BGZ60DRAFT_393772 [Tricladium varicosporioides]|nr:hypothetical protein BGZ60DRAFT_393772 [Hymenoscyphus varicosporioides]